MNLLELPARVLELEERLAGLEQAPPPEGRGGSSGLQANALNLEAGGAVSAMLGASIPGGAEIRTGLFNFPMGGNVQLAFTYTFPTPFSAAPATVILQCGNPSNLMVLDTQITDWTATGFLMVARYADNIGKTGLCLVQWLAIGPP